MSYCRWSSDDFHCDIYCYEHVGGYWVIHVAGNRVLGDIPSTKGLLSLDSVEAFIEAHRAQMAFLETAERAAIGLPYDGESFDCDTASDCADKLEELRAVGYIVPQYAIDALREEAENAEELK